MIAAAFGVVGYILKRLSLPSVPIILGMVLGGIMEVKLRAGMARVKEPLDFIDRPIALLLFVTIVLVLANHVRHVIKDKAALKEAETRNTRSNHRFGGLLKRRRAAFLKDRGRQVRKRHAKRLRSLRDLF